MATLSILLLATPQGCDQAEIDSFCELYTRVIINPGDEKITAPLAVKKRLLTNEKLYKQVCPKAKAA